MRTVFFSLLGSLLLTGAVIAQDKVDSERAQTYALALSEQASQVKDPNLKTDVDALKATAVRIAEHVALIIPDKKLTKETVSKAGKDVVPVGQLWLRNAVPAVADKAAPADKLRIIEMSAGDQDLKLPLCFLGLQKNEKGELELLIYGKDKEPLAKLPLKKAESKQELPIELEIKPSGDTKGELTIKLLGEHTAVITVAAAQL